MMVLAIETSTMLGGVALMDDARGLVTEVRLNVKATHSEKLMAEVHYVLGQSGVALGELDALAVAVGPGSFTGLRIAVSTAQGLAFATGVKLVSVPTLEAFACSLPFARYPVCPMLDARKKEVYAGVFVFAAGRMERLIPERAVAAGDLARELAREEGVVFMGEGARMYRAVLTEVLGGRAHFAPPGLMVPSPASLARLGMERARRGEFTEPAGLAPLYLRKSEAELKWKST
jgi:tRNA threonylcarbamoyladenosine biosynthesis protein TsaB